LVIALLVPSLVKVSRVFDDHVHQVCKNPQKIHIHEFDTDCAFYNFKLNTQFSIVANDFQFLKDKEGFQTICSQYHFLCNYKQLSFSLRGPPQLI